MEVLDESSATTWRVVNVIKEVSAQLWVFAFMKSSYFNVGSGESIRISNLVKLIKKKTSFKKKIFTRSKIIDNSKRVCGDVNLKKMLNYKIMYKLNMGIEETIAWYKKFY